MGSMAEERETERQWAEEAERRYEEIREGVAEPIDSDEVFREARARLERGEESTSALESEDDPERDLAELRRLTRQGQGRSRGRKLDREESHER